MKKFKMGSNKVLISFCFLFFSNFLIENVVCITMPLHDKYIVSWKKIGEDAIEFECVHEGLGFMGLGFNSIGSMGGSDLIYMGVRNGNPYLDDMYLPAGSAPMHPMKDPQNDYQLIEASENSTHTTVKFRRLLKTCDPNDYQITEDTLSLLYSWGDTDNLMYHGENRGSKKVNLLDPAMPEFDMSKYHTWNLSATLIMPKPHTTYYCTMHYHRFNKVHHMIGFDAILDSLDSKKHTHHIDIYKCDPPQGQSANETFGEWVEHPGVDCYYPAPEDAEFPVQHCKWIQFGWAIGGMLTVFPDYVGFPLEGDTYWMLETHLDNPNLLENIQISNGMKIYYTDTPRKIEGAQFLVGSVINMTQMIPPNSVDFVNVAHCMADCTNNFPDDGVKVFNILLHSHASGRKMKVRHWREGLEMPWIINDDNYDFNYQQNRPLVEELTFLPGDQFTLECIYDTTWKDGKSVIGGRATTEEMCMAFFFYYPRMPDLVECNSEMPGEDLLGFFGIEQVFQEESEEDATVVLPESMKGRKFTEVVESFNWTAEARALYQQKHRFEPHAAYCMPINEEDEFPGTYPVVDEYIPEDECAKVDVCENGQLGYKTFEENCGYYIICADGTAILKQCPGGQLFNIESEKCEVSGKIDMQKCIPIEVEDREYDGSGNLLNVSLYLILLGIFINF